MSTQSQPTPAQLGITLGQSLTAIANAQNQAAISNYNQAVTKYTSQYGTEPNLSLPGTPLPPTPPMLTLVNTNAVEALELEANALLVSGQGGALDLLNWTSVYSYIQYVPPPVVPPAPPAVATHTGTAVQTPFGEEWIP